MPGAIRRCHQAFVLADLVILFQFFEKVEAVAANTPEKIHKVIVDPARFVADPDKVHTLDFKGDWFDVKGPLTVPRSPHGRPVFLQAGSSGRGRDFAALDQGRDGRGLEEHTPCNTPC